jgi:putative ABC transport system permease protein
VEDQSAGAEVQRFRGFPFIEADRRAASTDYFKTMGITLIKGRFFTDADNISAPRVVIVDDTFERRFWPEGEALGQRVSVGFDQAAQRPLWGRIVGVVAHINHYGIDQVKQYGLKFEGREQIYFPLEQRSPQGVHLAIRTSVDPLSLTASVRSQVLAVDPDQPIYEVKAMDELLSAAVSQRQLSMLLFTSFSAIAVILAAVGIYGVLWYSVTQRTHEIGIRMALGARQGSVLAFVVRQGMLLVAIGLGIGLAAAFALTRVITSLLFGVSATDPITFVAIALMMSLVAGMPYSGASRLATRSVGRAEVRIGARCEVSGGRCSSPLTPDTSHLFAKRLGQLAKVVTHRGQSQ